MNSSYTSTRNSSLANYEAITRYKAKFFKTIDL